MKSGNEARGVASGLDRGRRHIIDMNRTEGPKAGFRTAFKPAGTSFYHQVREQNMVLVEDGVYKDWLFYQDQASVWVALCRNHEGYDEFIKRK